MSDTGVYHTSIANRLEAAKPSDRPVRAVLDTDTYNEVDDQFALAYALLSPEDLSLEAIYAAPFHNSRSDGPADGMEKSYDEIYRVLDLLGRQNETVYRGSASFLAHESRPVESDAAADLVRRASSSEGPLYVMAIGAITNVASALLLEPAIAERIVVVWLGGHAPVWPDNLEFNLRQDAAAARVVFDSGVPVIHIPCMPVASHLITTVTELEAYLDGKSRIGSYLTGIVRDYAENRFAWSKVIWDISAPAYLINPSWIESSLVTSPILTPELRWEDSPGRHPMRRVHGISRDGIFGDLFRKLAAAPE